MTGIERLRTLAGAWDEWGLGGALEDVADQIERERACDSDTAENIRLIVGGVIDDMERHVSGVEGADDSPVARWARELRRALKSDTSDGRGAQNPSWHDPAEAAGVTSDAPKVTRDPADDVSMSAYDLLPEEEREAIACVRDHGGLDSVKKLLDWVVGHCSTRQQLDFDFWLSGRVMYELGFEEDMADRDEVERRLLARLMPEGYEWPRYESGEPLRYEDRYVYDGREREVWHVDFDSCGKPTILNKDGTRCHPDKGERVVRSAPKVLDSDGVEIREGDTVWHVETGEQCKVVEVDSRSVSVDFRVDGDGTKHTGSILPANLTHRSPVLAADGRPLREGETVWHKSGFACGVVETIDAGSLMHTTRYRGDDGSVYRDAAKDLVHKRPDSWERLEEDAGKDPCGYFGFDGEEPCGKCPASGKNCEQTMAQDLVRRCRALAERERGE